MTRPAGVIERPEVKIDGTPVSVEVLDALIDLRVESTVSRPAQATLRFYDNNFELIDSAKMAIGAEIRIGLASTGQTTTSPVFVGEVTSIGIESGPDDSPILMLTAHDKSHRLGRASKQRVFAKQSYSDMIRTIAQEHGLQVAVTGLTTMVDHITQNVDDAAFLTEICRRSNVIWSVTASKLSVLPAALTGPICTLERGESLRRFRAQFDSAEFTEKVTVRSWDPKTKQAIVSVHAQKPASLTTSTLVSGSRTKTSSSFGAERLSGANVTASTSEADLVAQSLHGRLVSDELRVRGEADGDPAIAAGCTVKVERVGTKLSGNYFVTSAEHVYSGRDYVTRFTCGGVQPSTLADLVGGSAPSGHRLGAIIGVISAVGAGAEVGMVKVKLPTIGEEIESDWARVVSPGAGKSRGMQVMPTIGDEVLVVFENGDLRRPFVLGGLWNAKDTVPVSEFKTGNEVTDWSITSLVGHSLSFRSGQQPNKRNIELLLADGKTKLFLGEDKVELWANEGKTLQLKSGQGSITITAKGEIEIKGSKITLTGTQELAGKAPMVKLNADARMALEAGATLELKGSASAKLDGGGMTEVKGGLVKIN